MPPEMDSPIDLPERDPGARGLGWTSMTIAVATLLLLATNAVSISDWADELPPSPWQAQLATAADQWRATTDAIGLGTPRAWLHARWKSAEALRFGGAG